MATSLEGLLTIAAQKTATKRNPGQQHLPREGRKPAGEPIRHRLDRKSLVVPQTAEAGAAAAFGCCTGPESDEAFAAMLREAS